MTTNEIAWVPAFLPPEQFAVVELVLQTGERDFGVWTGSNWAVAGEIVQPVSWRQAEGMFRVAERVAAERVFGSDAA